MALSLTSSGQVSSSNTLTGVTVASGDTLLLVGTAFTDGGTHVSSAAWDPPGVNEALTQLKHNRDDINTGYSTDFWYRVSPTPATSKTVVLTMTGGTTQAVAAYVFAGADTSTPFGDMTLGGGTADTAGTASDPVTVSVTTATGEIVVDMMISQIGSTAGANQTTVLDSAATGTQLGSSWKDGVNGGTMSWTKDGGGTQHWCIAAVSVKSGTPPAPPDSVAPRSHRWPTQYRRGTYRTKVV